MKKKLFMLMMLATLPIGGNVLAFGAASNPVQTMATAKKQTAAEKKEAAEKRAQAKKEAAEKRAAAKKEAAEKRRESNAVAKNTTPTAKKKHKKFLGIF